MSTITLNQAFKAHGLTAVFEGRKAALLPLSNDVLDEIGREKLESTVGQKIDAGMMMAAWVTEDGKRDGKVLAMDAGNDIRIQIPRQGDAAPLTIFPSDMIAAAETLIKASREAAIDRETVAEANAEARRAYEKALARGEAPDEPEMATPEFAENAFARVPNFVDAVKDGLHATINDRFAEREAISRANIDMDRLGRLQADALTPKQKAKVREMRDLQREIGRLQPDHPSALAPTDRAYTGTEDMPAGAAASEALDTIDISGQGFSPAQMSALSGNQLLREEVFAVLTKTPVSDLKARMLAHQDFVRVAQDLARREEKTWAPTALDRVGQVLSARMPGYEWEAKLFTKDDADMLLVRDFNGAYLYAWDSASRVEEIDIEGDILFTATKDDVPSDDRLAELKAARDELQIDNGMDVDFGFDDPEDETPDADEGMPALG